MVRDFNEGRQLENTMRLLRDLFYFNFLLRFGGEKAIAPDASFFIHTAFCT